MKIRAPDQYCVRVGNIIPHLIFIRRENFQSQGRNFIHGFDSEHDSKGTIFWEFSKGTLFY
jgi:hypothetical protein